MKRKPGFAIREMKKVHEYTEKAKERLKKKVISTCEKLTDCRAERYVFLAVVEVTGAHVLGTEYVTSGMFKTNAKEEDNAIAQTMRRINEFAQTELKKM